jgi:hypothetical protein
MVLITGKALLLFLPIVSIDENPLNVVNIQEICSMKIIPLKEGNFSASKTKDFTLLTEDNFDTVWG